ncbi:hypothetical protein EW145_g5398 [Phellinidium pouzarii]|uniref:CRA domain-containing protein n=1 Tax=Phellinidium pouzarii TaxID=167371 RepID=A0A4S4L095_9AGAM|nr:hypothetical protein EW145_g5398 [Phellinidium pouzarii]
MSTSSVFQPSPQCLRELVLDYLLHNSYIDTARAFAVDTTSMNGVERRPERLAGDFVAETEEDARGTEVGGSADLNSAGISKEVIASVRLRREIRFHILSGRVDEATHLLNMHFPSVLQENDTDTSLPSRTLSPSASSPHARVHYTSQLSTKPIHIALNLRTLSFIEAARTVPLTYASDPPRISSNTASTATASSTPSLDRSSDAFSDHQTDLLHRAQRLYAIVESLRDMRDRDLYRKELNSVGGLLAYPAPEKSPMAKYMGQERREAVADQVNSAILYHLSQPATSVIELFARQTAALWSTMRDCDMKLPPPSQYPTGASPPPSSIQDILAPCKTGSSGKTEKQDAERIPAFDLHEFIDSP